MVLFKDISKAASDTISKDFPHDKAWEAEVKSKTGDFQLTTVAQVDGAKAFDANTAIKRATKSTSFEAKVSANGSSSLEFKYTLPEKCKPIAGAVLGAKFDRKKGGKAPSDVLELYKEYQGTLTHTKLSLLPFTSSFTASSLVNYQAFKAGAEVSSRFDFSNLSYSLGASYSPNGNFTAAVKTIPDGKTPFAKIVGSAFVKSDKTEVGAEVNFDVGAAKANISVAGKFDIDKTSTVKAKLTHDAKAAIAVTTVLNPIVTSTLGFQFDAANPSAADSLKYGAKFNISH